MFPICPMYGMFTSIYHQLRPNVDEYSIYGAFGNSLKCRFFNFDSILEVPPGWCGPEVHPSDVSVGGCFPGRRVRPDDTDQSAGNQSGEGAKSCHSPVVGSGENDKDDKLYTKVI